LIAFTVPIKLAASIVAESLSMLLGKERMLPTNNISGCAGISTTEVSGTRKSTRSYAQASEVGR